MRNFILPATVVAAALSAAPSSAATFTTYSNRTVFEAAAGAVSKESFNSYATDTDLTNKTIDFGSFKLSSSYTINQANNALIDTPPVAGGGIGNDGTSLVRIALTQSGNRYSELVIDFAEPTKAFGANFSSGSAGQVYFDVMGNSLTGSVAGDGFFGFTSDTAFTRIVLKPRAGSSFQVTMDNVTFAAGTGVPEPASWAMMIAGFGLAGGALRARPRGRLAAAS